MTEPLGPKPPERGVCPHCGRPWHEGVTCEQDRARLPKIPRSHTAPDRRDRWWFEEDGEDRTAEEWTRMSKAASAASSWDRPRDGRSQALDHVRMAIEIVLDEAEHPESEPCPACGEPLADHELRCATP